MQLETYHSHKFAQFSQPSPTSRTLFSPTYKQTKKRTILSLKKQLVAKLNEDIIKHLPGELHVYKSVDTVADPASLFPQLNSSIHWTRMEYHLILYVWILEVRWCYWKILNWIGPATVHAWLTTHLPHVITGIIITGCGKGGSSTSNTSYSVKIWNSQPPPKASITTSTLLRNADQ